MCVTTVLIVLQVFLVRRIMGKDAGKLYAMKVLKKASLKGKVLVFSSEALFGTLFTIKFL